MMCSELSKDMRIELKMRQSTAGYHASPSHQPLFQPSHRPGFHSAAVAPTMQWPQGVQIPAQPLMPCLAPPHLHVLVITFGNSLEFRKWPVSNSRPTNRYSSAAPPRAAILRSPPLHMRPINSACRSSRRCPMPWGTLRREQPQRDAPPAQRTAAPPPPRCRRRSMACRTPSCGCGPSSSASSCRSWGHGRPRSRRGWRRRRGPSSGTCGHSWLRHKRRCAQPCAVLSGFIAPACCTCGSGGRAGARCGLAGPPLLLCVQLCWVALQHFQDCHPEVRSEYSEFLYVIGPDDPTLVHSCVCATRGWLERQVAPAGTGVPVWLRC